MSVYAVLAIIVDVIHVLVILYWCTGWFVPKSRYPMYRMIHSLFGVVVFTTQLVFSMRCPLVLVSGYLREMANPGFASRGFYQPFTVTMLKNVFGFEAPQLCVTVITVIGTGIMLITLISIKAKPQEIAP